jgi:hypothetical protein
VGTVSGVRPLDRIQHGLPTSGLTDRCAHPAAGPHGADLFDMTARDADACTAEEVMGHLHELPTTVAG